MKFADFLTLTVEILGLFLVMLTLKKEILQLKLLQKKSLDTSKKVESCLCRDPSTRTRLTD